MALVPGKKTIHAWRVSDDACHYCFVGNGPKPSQDELQKWIDKYRNEASTVFEVFVDYDVERSQWPDSEPRP